MTALLLSLISLVAVFCVMNTLLVLTVQKTPEIGLLKALGFRKGQIMKVFMVHGMIQCGVGIVLGLMASWAVLSNLQGIVEWLARMGLEVFPASVLSRTSGVSSSSSHSKIERSILSLRITCFS